MILRRALDGDSEYFYTLRTDPTAALMSRRPAPTPEQHAIWWRRALELRYVAEENGKRIGTIRISRNAEVSIVVDPSMRGLGYGPKMLEALKPLAKAEGYDTLLAEIAYDNNPSQRCFRKAGWKPILWELHI